MTVDPFRLPNVRLRFYIATASFLQFTQLRISIAHNRMIWESTIASVYSLGSEENACHELQAQVKFYNSSFRFHYNISLVDMVCHE